MRRHNVEGFHVDTARPDSHDNPEPSQGPDDATVIRRSWCEPEQFALLFHRHAASLSRYATRRLGPQLAEDIVADTFLTAFRQRDRYDPSRADARPWLHGIAANLIRRYHRDETRWLQALERTGIDPVADSAADLAEARLTADAAARAVAAAVAALSPPQREVVLLITWAGLTYDQVAEALGIPEGTVRSRTNRARSRLRAALTELNPHEYLRSEEINHA
jgi:RNA polymerase sigma factor (sigma-70 family)